MFVKVAPIAFLACVALHHVLDVRGADLINVSKRFRYSLHKNHNQAYDNPSIEALLGVPQTVRFVAVHTDKTVHGVVRRRFKQVYNDRIVLGTSVEANINDAGNYDFGPVTGNIVLSMNDEVPANCTLSEEDAEDIVIQNEAIPLDALELDRHIETDVEIVGSTAHLVYVVDLLYWLPNGEETRPYYIIDCTNGTVIDHFNLIQTMASSYQPFTGPTQAWSSPTPQTPAPPTGTPAPTTHAPVTPAPTTQAPSGQCSTQMGPVKGGNGKLGAINYGTPPYCLDLTVSGTKCVLDNQYLTVVDAQKQESTSNTNPVEFTCSQGFTDEVNGGYNPSADALFYGTSAFKMMKEWYDVTPLNHKPKMYVHYGQSMDNAIWDGSNMLFGDGGTDYYPFTSLNIVGHELAHGFTEQKSNLEYSGQSGGIDEAFCDMAGETLEQYLRNSYDWKVSLNILKNSNGVTRDFADPTTDGDSIDHVSKFTSGMDVHYSSGIYNKVFYEVVETGKVPIRYAFESFVKANGFYWVKNTNFQSGSCGAIRGALDAGVDVQRFIDAFNAVGITRDCKINTLLEQLTQTKDRTGVMVSSIRQPIFGVRTGSSTSQITVTATSASGADVKLVVMTSLNRSSSKLPASTNSLVSSVSANTQYYIRLYTDSNTEISDVTVNLQLG